MKIKSSTLSIIIFVVVFGGIFATSALNLWKTESSKIPVTYSSGEFAGQYNPEDIRGSYSFDDVSSLFDIPLEDLAKAFGLPENIDPSGFKNKDLENMYESLAEEGTEIGNGSVKIFVALYKGLPTELSDDTYLPTAAVEIIINSNSSLTEDQINYLHEHSIDIEGFNSNLDPTATSPSEKESEDEEMLVKGKTTFKEILDWGVEKDYIEELIGGKMPSLTMSIRDYCVSKEIGFQSIKESLQIVIDELHK